MTLHLVDDLGKVDIYSAAAAGFDELFTET